MIKVLDGVENIGEELKCEWCGSVIHFEDEDLFDVEYYIHDTKRNNQAINCPKCQCLIFRWED